MRYDLLANLLWNFGAFIILAFVVYRAVFPLFVAEFRHELFALRRDLFLFMAQGEIAPNHPAYARMRTTINGLLYRAEDLTGLNLIVSLAIAQREAHRAVRSTAAEIRRTSDPRARAHLMEIHDRMSIAIVRHLQRIRFISPVLSLVWVLGKVLRLRKLVVQVVEADGFASGGREVEA